MPGFRSGFSAPGGGPPPPEAPGFLSRGIYGTETPPPPPTSTTEGVDYCVVACDMWGCAYGELAGVQVTQAQWQLNDKGAATVTFPIQQVATSTFGADLTGLSNRDTLPYACIPGGRELQIWRDQELIWWGLPITATPSTTLVTLQCQGLLWWLDGVLFGPTLTESLIDGDFEVSGTLGSLDAYWPSASPDPAMVTAEIVDANSGAAGVITGRYAAKLTSTVTAGDLSAIEARYVVDEVFDGLPVTVTAWATITEWLNGPLNGNGIVAVLYSDDTAIDSWVTQLTAAMPVGVAQQLTLNIGPIVVDRSLPVTYGLGLQLWTPEGGIIWDDVHVTVQAPPFNGTATEIVTDLVAYAQDPTQGKSTFAMPVEVIGPAPVEVLQRDYLGQSQNSAVLGAFAEFVAEGYFDYGVTWDPTGHFRTFTMYCPSKGQMQYNYPLTLDAGTVTQLGGTVDGSQVGTSQRVLGQGSGGAGSEAAYRAFGGFLASGRGAGFPGGRTPRVITDGIIATTAGATSATLVSLSAAFDTDDVGQPVTCLAPGVLPPGCYIGAVLSVYEAEILSSDEGLVTSTGGSLLTVSIGGFTIEQSNSAQTNQPPGALAGLAQGNLLRNAAAQAMLSPRMRATGTDGTNGLFGNVVVGDVIPVATDYGWLTITGDVDGEPVLQRVVAMTLFPVTEEIQPTLNVINTALGGAIDVADLPGVAIPYCGAGVPMGYVLCDGTGYDPATYPSLFGAIGYLWGGSGSTFNVPDFRGRALVGAGGGHAVGDTFGQTTVTLVQNNIPAFASPGSITVDVSVQPTVSGGVAAEGDNRIVISTASGPHYLTLTPGDQAVTFTSLDDKDTSGTSFNAMSASVSFGNASPTAVDTVPPSAAVQWILRAF